LSRNLILVLGDQLDKRLEVIANADKKNDLIVMMEVMTEATYADHHTHKLIFIFSAMRQFASQLKKSGYSIKYIHLDDKANKQSFVKNIQAILNNQSFDAIRVTEPGEYRLLKEFNGWESKLAIPTYIYEDRRFLCSINTFKKWSEGKKQLRMEFFYRFMRQKTGYLMEGSKPTGGQWNFDNQNRKKLPNSIAPPKPIRFIHNQTTLKVIELIRHTFKSNPGFVDNFNMATNRQQALKALNGFIAERLPNFGTYQDAMAIDETQLFHSQLSAYINVGLLSPREVLDEAIYAYKNQKIELHNIEGFVRQILGWREYVRGMYWLKMPEYNHTNFFKHKHPLPHFFWTAETDMLCLKQSISDTLKHAALHHIQRLMIIGNFALLVGSNPDEVCHWYLSVYADAFEWVEMPNTFGMSQFADGGVIASKPYISSGSYINRMSNFCSQCTYNVKHKFEEDACPFNFLYWAFLIKHEDKLGNNPRMAMMYRQLNKFSPQEKIVIEKKANKYIKKLAN
jgi:deoxyribodipyrimidine photolyase-related protein